MGYLMIFFTFIAFFRFIAFIKFITFITFLSDLSPNFLQWTNFLVQNGSEFLIVCFIFFDFAQK